MLNAIAYNSERVVVGGMRDSNNNVNNNARCHNPPSLVHAMNVIEDTHKAALQQASTSDSISSLMSSLNGMSVSNQDNGFSLPINLEEFGRRD